MFSPFFFFFFKVSRLFNASTQLWSDRQGVLTRPGAGLDAINWLDPASVLTRRESVYFAYTTASFLAAGWNSTSLAGFPFDWRMHPAEPEQLAVWPRLKAAIESLVVANGRPAILISHSMGCPILQYFLTTQVSAEWKSQNVAAWIPVAGPFAGASAGVKSLLSGYNFGIPVLTNAQGLEVGPNLGSTFFLLPRQDVDWGALVTTVQGTKYFANDVRIVCVLRVCFSEKHGEVGGFV